MYELDWKKLIELQEKNELPKIRIPFSLNTSYLKRKFGLDVIIWNLSEKNLEQTKRMVLFVLENFDALFETGWTALYYYLCANPDPGAEEDVSEHTLQEFFEDQIDFEHEEQYYLIQLEVNCKHFKDSIPRYCFVVQTICDYSKWMIAEDNMRLYMVGNKCWGFNDNNDDMQMAEPLENVPYYNGGNKKLLTAIYKKMSQEGFSFAECKFQ